MSLIDWLGCHEVGSQAGCHPISLSSKGTIIINSTFSITLDQTAIFEPVCDDDIDPETGSAATVLDYKDAFYASTSPQLYALATATIVAYLLVIMLFITPHTFFIGGHGGGFLTRRGMISGSYGSSSAVGVGGRPWLQKLAVITVAIALTVATSKSFSVANEQYDMGYMDSSGLTDEVLNSLAIRIIRVMSTTFLWLAQVQTLIRLFPRHKEKVIIKWVGFALIVLDTIFSILNNFVTANGTFQPRRMVDAIPALNYLFQSSLSMLYAAWVIFYSLSKRRYAFFHVRMKNICLVALLSLVAVHIPITFFILDLSKPIVAGWGEYIRWVGAAAASVVVWEWVERIEALEREERKDGILGREVFDGDEMLDVTPSEEVDWPGVRRGGDNGGGGKGTASTWADRIGLSSRPLGSRVTFARRLPRPRRAKRHRSDFGLTTTEELHPERPPQAVIPASRADTASVASTIYRVRYHSVPSPAPLTSRDSAEDEEDDMDKELSAIPSGSSDDQKGYEEHGSTPVLRQGIAWFNLFKRRRMSPPQEVATAQAEDGKPARTVDARRSDGKDGRWNLKSTTNGVLSLFHRDRGKSAPEKDDPETLPVTVIPARTRQEQPTASDTNEPTITTRPHQQPAHRVESHQRNDSLPVMVIPARPRSSSRTWSTPVTDEPHPNNHMPDAARRHSADRESPGLLSSRPGTECHVRDQTVRTTAPGRGDFAPVREAVTFEDEDPATVQRTSNQRSTYLGSGDDAGDISTIDGPSSSPNNQTSGNEHRTLPPSDPGQQQLDDESPGVEPGPHPRDFSENTTR